MERAGDFIGILTEREEHYGDARVNHERIAAMWSAYLDTEIAAHDVAAMMILMKVCRAKVANHADNYVDIRGYAMIAEKLR